MLMRTETAMGIEAAPREAPHNIDAEQALLGAILVHNEAYERVVDVISAGHFYDPLHQALFETAAKMLAAGTHVSAATLRTFFENAPPITDDLTVPEYLNRLAFNAATVASARAYAETIRDLAIRRQIIAIGQDAAEAAFEADIDTPPSVLIEETEQALFALAEAGSDGRSEVTFAQSVDVALERMQEALKHGGRMRGLSTGLADLDDKLGGLVPARLYILAGRPGMGKTALATNIAWHVAKSGTHDDNGECIPAPVDFFSLEMAHDELTERIVSGECGVSSSKLQRGTAAPHEVEAAIRAGSRIRNVPLIIDDRGGVTLAQIAARARRRKRKHGTALIVIDYLQLIRGKGRENRVQEITEITTGLKALAKELHVPIIALSQLSRAVEQRENKRPQLSDLRDSGSIEQDADVVLFAYREEYYIRQREPDGADGAAYSKWQEELLAAQGKAEVIIAKQRQGPTGSVPLAFQAELTRFSNLSRQGGDYA